MGAVSVQTMIDHINGLEVDPVIDTGVTVATPDNMDDPAVAPLLE